MLGNEVALSKGKSVYFCCLLPSSLPGEGCTRPHFHWLSLYHISITWRFFSLFLTFSDFITKFLSKLFTFKFWSLDSTPWAVSPQAYITGSLHPGTIVSNSYRMWNTCHPNPVLDLVSPKSVPGQALDQTETQGAQWLPPLRDRHSLAAIVHPV